MTVFPPFPPPIRMSLPSSALPPIRSTPRNAISIMCSLTPINITCVQRPCTILDLSIRTHQWAQASCSLSLHVPRPRLDSANHGSTFRGRRLHQALLIKKSATVVREHFLLSTSTRAQASPSSHPQSTRRRSGFTSTKQSQSVDLSIGADETTQRKAASTSGDHPRTSSSIIPPQALSPQRATSPLVSRPAHYKVTNGTGVTTRQEPKTHTSMSGKLIQRNRGTGFHRRKKINVHRWIVTARCMYVALTCILYLGFGKARLWTRTTSRTLLNNMMVLCVDLDSMVIVLTHMVATKSERRARR